MSVFVYTPHGYVNLNEVVQAKPTLKGRYVLTSDKGVIDHENVAFADTIVSTQPAQGEWECLEIAEGTNGQPGEVMAQPVLAWGLTTLGLTVPITPASMGDTPPEKFALRKKGETQVYEPGNYNVFESAEAWMAENLKAAA